jgi:hypothetical protein
MRSPFAVSALSPVVLSLLLAACNTNTSGNGGIDGNPGDGPIDGPRAQPSDGLTVENAVATPITLQWIYPVEDASAAVTSRHRMVPSGDTWEEGLEVIGGSPPYNYTCNTCPPGMQVLYVGYDTLVPPFYAALRWMNPQIGDFTVDITVQDQANNSANLVYTGHVYDRTDTTRFVYFNAGTGNNANTGAPDSPKQDLRAAFGPTEDDPTNQAKQLFFAAGTYNVGGHASGLEYDGARIILNDSKSTTWVGLYDEVVKWSISGAPLALEMTSGLRISNITFTNPHLGTAGVDLQRKHMGLAGAFSNGGMYKGGFEGYLPDVANDASNNACILMGDTQGVHERMAFTALHVTGVRNQLVIQNYNVSKIGISGWTVDNSPNITLVHNKGGDIRDVQLYGLKAIESVAGSVAYNIEWINNPIARHRLGIVWSNIRFAGIGILLNSGPPDDYANIFSARNCWNISYHLLGAGSGDVAVTRDAIQHSGMYPNGELDDDLNTVTNTDLLVETSGLFDPTTNLLTGAYRTSGLGNQGCEMTRQ